jgi:hypothetical protein
MREDARWATSRPILRTEGPPKRIGCGRSGRFPVATTAKTAQHCRDLTGAYRHKSLSWSGLTCYGHMWPQRRLEKAAFAR